MKTIFNKLDIHFIAGFRNIGLVLRQQYGRQSGNRCFGKCFFL